MDKMREQFEEWRLAKFCGGEERLKKCSNAPDVYYYTSEQEAWKAWQASRAALVIELPMPAKPVEPEDAFDDSWMDGYHAAVRTRNTCISLIQSAGIPAK